MTAQQASQFNANAIKSTNASQPNITDAFENIAAATAADRTAVINLITSNQALLDALQTRSSKLHAANVANTTLQQKVAKLERNFATLRAQLSSTVTTQALPAPPTQHNFYRAPTRRSGHVQG